MAKPKGKMHQITVTVTNKGDEGVSFSPSSDLWDDTRGHFMFDKRRHHMRPDDYHLVEFVLDDRTAEGLRFPADPEAAMWVAKADDGEHYKCPDASTGHDYEVIDPMSVSDDGQRLFVCNRDPRQECWAFTLNMEEASGGAERRVSWDPIFNNGGNGGQ